VGNRILKDHLSKAIPSIKAGFQEHKEQIVQLQGAIQLLERAVINQSETMTDTKELVRVLAVYAQGLAFLDDYDHERLEYAGSTRKAARVIEPDEFLLVVEGMRRDFDSEVFGKTPKRPKLLKVLLSRSTRASGVKNLYRASSTRPLCSCIWLVKNHSLWMAISALPQLYSCTF
jgi:hypothetical protein